MKKDIQALLRQKAQELSQEVSQWAEKELELGPGESIYVVLRLEITPLTAGVAPTRGGFLDVSLTNFFTRQRCLDLAGDASLATKVRNYLSDQHPWDRSINQEEPELRTVGDLIVFGRGRLFKVKHIGKVSVKKIEQVLASEGLYLDE